MKRRLIFLVLVAFAILGQIGWYYLLTVFGLRHEGGLLFCLTILSGAAFWYLPFWYVFVYSKQQKTTGPDIES